MKKTDIIRYGREVLEIESRAVAALVPRLDQNFAKAVDLLAENKSRIIVTGMGKSGLIGRKIAATLASCGTPAIFIHPAEAGHGDLGMILKTTSSWPFPTAARPRRSSTSSSFIKRIGVKLITITGNRNRGSPSTAISSSTPRSSGRPVRTDLVPTASSTAALALGDALAIALMKKKGFSEEDFALLPSQGSDRQEADQGRDAHA